MLLFFTEVRHLKFHQRGQNQGTHRKFYKWRICQLTGWLYQGASTSQWFMMTTTCGVVHNWTKRWVYDFTIFQFFHEVALEAEFSRTVKIKEEQSCRFLDRMSHVGCFAWFHHLGVFFMKRSAAFWERWTQFPQQQWWGTTTHAFMHTMATERFRAKQRQTQWRQSTFMHNDMTFIRTMTTESLHAHNDNRTLACTTMRLAFQKLEMMRLFESKGLRGFHSAGRMLRILEEAKVQYPNLPVIGYT